MKKFLIIILHFIAIFAILIGVGLIPRAEEQGTNEIFTGELETNIKLKILENDTAKKQGYLDELIAAFNEEYKEYGIVAEDANMSESSDLETDGPYGYGPDVLYQANDQIMGYVDGRHIMPIPLNLINDYDQINENAWAAYERDGVYYGVPVNVQESLLYYRKDLIPDDWQTTWDENQNDVPDMIESWPALYKFSKQLKEDSNPDTYGFMMSYDQPYMSLGYLFSYGGYIFGENDTDPTDVGIANENSYLGANVIRQQASQMDQRCVDNSITLVSYSELAKGNFFATATTPDVYTRFTAEFDALGLDADELLGVTTLPQLPESGDLEDMDSPLFRATTMGGINGYCISSYTESPNACLAFINFATKYEMIQRRVELLGIVPAREDLASVLDGVSPMVYDDLAEGYIYLMPSISQLSAVWGSMGTLFVDLVNDPYRDYNSSNPPKYDTLDKIKARVEAAEQEIIDTLNTLGG